MMEDDRFMPVDVGKVRDIIYELVQDTKGLHSTGKEVTKESFCNVRKLCISDSCEGRYNPLFTWMVSIDEPDKPKICDVILQKVRDIK